MRLFAPGRLGLVQSLGRQCSKKPLALIPTSQASVTGHRAIQTFGLFTFKL